MKRLMLFCLLIASLISQITKVAFAGYNYEEFQITHFQASEDHFTINLVTTKNPLYDKCHTVTLSGSYNDFYWLWQSLRFRTPSRREHMYALHLLKTAYENEQTIKYSWLDWRSITKEENGVCDVKARALYVSPYDTPPIFLSQMDTI